MVYYIGGIMDTIGKELVVNGDMSGTIESIIMPLDNILHYAIQCNWTGVTADGDIHIDVSAELGAPSNWSRIASATVLGDGTQLWFDRNVPYKWVRIVYIPNAGTGVLSVEAILKGDK